MAAAAPTAAAAPVVAAQAAAKATICHATGSTTNPFVLIEIADAALNAHLGNHGDVSPVNGACPGAITPPPPGGRVTICHVTGSATNPFVIITVDDNALPAHLAHGDVAAVGGACPGPLPPPVIPPPPVVVPEVIVRPVVHTAVRGTVRETVTETVRAQSFSEIVPVVRFAERATPSRERTGTLPATGTEVGSMVLLGLLLLLAGAGASRTGKLRLGAADAPTGWATTNRPEVPGSVGVRQLRQANAPPLQPPRTQ